MNLAVSTILLAASLVVVSSQSCIGSNQGHWVSATDGNVPEGAVAGGVDKGRTLYICRSNGISGKIFESSPCYYAENKKEIRASTYEVLTDLAGVWISPVGSNYPCNMLETSDGMYSCRVTYKKAMTIGKFENGICIIPYGGKSHKFKKNFEVFTAVSENVVLNQGADSAVFDLSGQYLTFQLKSGSESVVSVGNGNNMMFRVAIGALKNSVVSIGLFGQPYAVVESTPTILSDTEFNSYWLRWTSGNKLEFGKEGNSKPLATYANSGVKDINSFQLYSTFGASEWNVPQ